MFSLVPERLSASQAATQKQRREAEREQGDDYDLEAGARMWSVAKDTNNTAAVNAALAYVDACRDVLAGAPDKKKDLRHARDRLALVARQAQPRVRVCTGGVRPSRRVATRFSASQAMTEPQLELARNAGRKARCPCGRSFPPLPFRVVHNRSRRRPSGRRSWSIASPSR